MSTLLATEIFQARRDAALASSKLLLDNSSFELRNAPINSKTLFDGRIKEIAKSNFEAQQQRFLASTSIQTQSRSFKPPTPSRAFKTPKYPVKQTMTRPKPTQSYRSKTQPQSTSSHTKKENIKRTGNIRQFPSSKPASSSTRLWRPALSTACTSVLGHSRGRTNGPFCGKMGGNYRQQMGPLYRTTRIQDTIQQNSSFAICSDQNESILLPVYQRRDRNPSQQTGSGKGTESGNSRLLFPVLPSSKKERKVTFDHRPFLIEPMHKETVFQNGNSQVSKTNDVTQRLGCLHRLNRCIPTRSDTSSIPEVSSFRLLHGLTVRNVSKSVDIFETDGRYSSVSTPTCHISFSIPRRLADQKSDSQPFDYSDKILHSNYSKSRFSAKSKEIGSLSFSEIHLIGMEFLTQLNLVRVPTDRVQNILLTIKKFLSFKHVSARTFLSLLGKLSASADFVLLGRLHLRPLQVCLLSVWKPHILPLDHPITINGMIRSHLQWWINPNRFETGTTIHPQNPKFFLYTDASHFGWGAHLEPTRLSFHGRWTED